MLAAFQRQFIFPGALVEAPARADEGIPGLEKIWLERDGHRVEAWFLPCDRNVAPVVIFGHGNGELIDHWPHALQTYREMGYHVLLPEYRGYGRSAGRASEAALVGDFVAFHDTIVSRADVDGVVLHGRSLGGGVVCGLARKRRPDAVILESTFTSMVDMLAMWMVPPFMVADRFESLEWVSGFDGRVLVMHGKRDSIVPYSHGVRLAEAAKHGQLITFDTDHNDMPDRVTYWREIAAFLGS